MNKEYRVVDIDVGNFNKDTIEYAVIIIKNGLIKLYFKYFINPLECINL